MSQKVCTQCGMKLMGDEIFCPGCGHVVEKGVQEQALAAPKTEMTNVLPAGTEQPASGKRGKKLTPLSVVLSILICLVLIILGTGTSLVGIVKMSLRETTIETVIEKAVENVALAELEPEKLLNSEKSGETLPKLIYDSIEPEFKQCMPKEKKSLKIIGEILEEDFVKDFLAEKAQDYVSDILTDSGEGKIEVEEVTKLIKKNREKLEELTQGEYQISNSDIEYIGEYLEQNEILEDMKFSELQKENESDFDFEMVQKLLSYSGWMLGLLAGLFVLFLVLLFLANGRFRRSMVYLGISILLVGAADVTLAIMTGRISEMLNDLFMLGKKFYNALLSPVRTNSLIVGGCTLLVGLLVLILPQVFRKKQPAAGR